MDNGVIFISIDDNEADNLRKVCNEVFGEDSFVADICVVNNLKGRNDKKYIATANERLLMYVKTEEFNEYGLSLGEQVTLEYREEDDGGKYRLLELRKRGGADTRKERPNMYYPFYVDPQTGLVSLQKSEVFSIEALPVKSDGVDSRWRWGKDTSESKLTQLYGRLVQGANKYNIYVKDYLEYDGVARRIRPKSVMAGAAYSTDVATKEYRTLMEKIDFNNPKPVAMISDLVEYSASPASSAIILDFFSGSSTTAHAVMQLNAEDGGNRKFICVQLPETCDESSEAFKADYKNICEIGKERIRRAGDKIKKEKGLEAQNLDIGFKVLKLDTSNIRKWQPDYEDLEQTLLDHIDNYVDGRPELDVVYEIMLKYGLDLTYPVDEFTVAQKKVYSIGFGMLMICLDDEITTEVAKGILAQVKELAPESTRVVFKDNGFKSDSNKTNIKEILKCDGIEEFITL